jgi:cob(I)alamin adenosyltransferase
VAFKIYTKTGDAGETSLFGGRRVSKSDLRVDAYGTADELNAHIGCLIEACVDEPVRTLLREVQNRLFAIGASLASDPKSRPPAATITLEHTAALENAIDAMEQVLPTLKNFILPGGHPTVALCHVCRTVCRRAERLVVALHHIEPVEEEVLRYLNRLSDYLFVLSRYLGLQLGAAEIPWKQ